MDEEKNLFINKTWRKISPYGYFIPLLLIYITFFIYPVMRVIVDSFYNYKILSGERKFIGLENFINIFSDKVLGYALRNNFLYLVGLLILIVPAAILLAFILNRNDLKGQRIFNTIYLIPYIIPLVGTGYLFKMLFNYDYGLITKILDVFGLSFLKRPWMIKFPDVIIIIIIVSLWVYLGSDTIFLYASMQQVPKEIYESAELDGVNTWQKLTKITIPMIRDMITVIVGSNIIGGLTQFVLFYVMLSSIPQKSLHVMSTYIIQQAFKFDNMGYASALSLLLLIMVMIITFIYIYIRQRGSYEK